MEYTITAISQVTFGHKDGDLTSKHIETNYNIEISKNLDPKSYHRPDDTLTEIGVKSASSAFIQGLAANIHYAHQHKLWDSADHLRYVIAQLERAFIAVATITKGEFKE